MPKKPYKIPLKTQIAGGHARAKALSAKRRREIAQLAARARWNAAAKA